MIAKKNRSVIFIAALISILGAYFGLFVSFKYDFPAGSSIVAVLGGLFLLVSIYYIAKSFKIFNFKKTQ
jgi:ABC-type Mn2+/Zn2+ transport system permease subunit